MSFPLKQRTLIRGFQAHVNAGLGGAADYVAQYVPLYAPFDGTIETYFGQQGGNWSRLIRSNGDKIEHAHLSKYLVKWGQVKEGQHIAYTGNTGQITTGPHLHIQIFRNNVRLDPELYPWTMTTIPIIAVNAPQGLLETAIPRIEQYLKGSAKIAVRSVSAQFTPPAVGTLTTTQAMQIIDTLPLNGELGCYIFYPPTPTSVYEVASFYPEKNLSFVTTPMNCGEDVIVHSFLHVLRKYINFNHLGYVEDVEHYLPNWDFENQYNELIPLILKLEATETIMTEKEVKEIYKLAFYRLPDSGELSFWKGKPLSIFLETAIKDRATFLTQPL